MRPGTLGICASIKHKYEVDTVPHVLCGGFTKKKKPNISGLSLFRNQ
jgi:methylenetetrahydrofolate reductase (NADPH)